jgi:hypothetical protein
MENTIKKRKKKKKITGTKAIHFVPVTIDKKINHNEKNTVNLFCILITYFFCFFSVDTPVLVETNDEDLELTFAVSSLSRVKNETIKLVQKVSVFGETWNLVTVRISFHFSIEEKLIVTGTSTLSVHLYMEGKSVWPCKPAFFYIGYLAG